MLLKKNNLGGYVGNNPVNFIDPWGLSASEKRTDNNATFTSRLKNVGQRMAEVLQNGAEWVWNNRDALLEMELGATLVAGGEMVKRGGQGAGFTIAAGGSIGTVGLGSPEAVGTGIAVGVSATTIGNAIQATGAALMIEGCKNLKGNDKRRNKQELSQSAKDAKKLSGKEADKLAQEKEKGYEDVHDLKDAYVGDTWK